MPLFRADGTLSERKAVKESSLQSIKKFFAIPDEILAKQIRNRLEVGCLLELSRSASKLDIIKKLMIMKSITLSVWTLYDVCDLTWCSEFDLWKQRS